ncbi:putative beta-hydroxydecanoyl thiol ester dehydrase, FabA/FabZ, HotDog domain superfamily [Helianthus annuus]|nr:putative beta-hydroxydecanoyl thiol ester dehydrase, FabA/FabZ, HotDog domain superfamily [Helianthus annuus]
MASSSLTHSIISPQSPISNQTPQTPSINQLRIPKSPVFSTQLKTIFTPNCASSAIDTISTDDTPIELKYPAFPTVVDINQIRDILPHRFPFLLVDRVIEYNPGVSAVGIKNVTINDNFFPGHFPDRPIMPGVLMVEGLRYGKITLRDLFVQNKKVCCFCIAKLLFKFTVLRMIELFSFRCLV